LREKGAGRTGPRGKGGPDGLELLGWVWVSYWVSIFLFYFLFFSFLNLIQTKFEFKYGFEFKPHSNKSMHQHECNTKFKPMVKF